MDKLITKVRFLSFLSFKLKDSKTRYTMLEREALVVIKGLKEV